MPFNAQQHEVGLAILAAATQKSQPDSDFMTKVIDAFVREIMTTLITMASPIFRDEWIPTNVIGDGIRFSHKESIILCAGMILMGICSPKKEADGRIAYPPAVKITPEGLNAVEQYHANHPDPILDIIMSLPPRRQPDSGSPE